MRFATITLLALFLILAGGCSSLTQSEVALVDQARQGIKSWSARETARRQALEQDFSTRRDAVDRAFDADLLARPALDPAWVIESRKAYRLALDALARQELAAAAATDTALANAQATDAALERLRWLISIRGELDGLFKR